jgi:hypothetical protein
MIGMIGWRTSRGSFFTTINSADSTVEDTVGCEFITQGVAVAV